MSLASLLNFGKAPEPEAQKVEKWAAAPPASSSVLGNQDDLLLAQELADTQSKAISEENERLKAEEDARKEIALEEAAKAAQQLAKKRKEANAQAQGLSNPFSTGGTEFKKGQFVCDTQFGAGRPTGASSIGAVVARSRSPIVVKRHPGGLGGPSGSAVPPHMAHVGTHAAAGGGQWVGACGSQWAPGCQGAAAGCGGCGGYGSEAAAWGKGGLSVDPWAKGGAVAADPWGKGGDPWGPAAWGPSKGDWSGAAAYASSPYGCGAAGWPPSGKGMGGPPGYGVAPMAGGGWDPYGGKGYGAPAAYGGGAAAAYGAPAAAWPGYGGCPKGGCAPAAMYGGMGYGAAAGW